MSSVAQKQVPEGYKKTELGIIPESWIVTNIGSIGRFKNGINKDGDSFGHGDPLVNLMDVFGKTSIGPVESLGLIDSNDVDKKEYDLRAGDVLFIRSSVKPSGVGLTAVVKKDMRDVVYSGFLIRYRSDSKLSAAFKEYCFYDSGFRKRVIAASSVSANTNINQDNLKRLLLAYPQSLEEQTAIANALSDIDALITSLEKLIAKKRAIKTATMQQLLTGKKRLPPFDRAHTGYKQTELGSIPEDWEVSIIGSKCNLLTGFPFPSSKYSENGVRLLRGSNVKRGVTDWSEGITQYWPALTTGIRQYELKEKDIVISMDGSLVGRSFAQLNKADLPAILLQRVARLRSDNVEIDYLKEWVCSIYFTEHCDSVKTVTAIPHISPEDIRNFRFLLPPTKEEQHGISNALSNMHREIGLLDQRLNKAQQIKQGMMQELLTGRTRLV